VRRRKVFYPPPKTATSGGSAAADVRAAVAASRVVSIDLTARQGRTDIAPGTRVEIASGLYAGEAAVVESLIAGVIPAALVRTEAGRTRRVRAIDLVPRPASSPPRPTEPSGPTAG
jgi:hypothetical protein